MIVTRRHRRRRGLGRFALPLLALAVLAIALIWPPSQRAIAGGPLKPVWNAGAGAVAVVARPLTFAAAQEQITDKNRAIRDLNGRLETQRQAKAAAEARIAQLQQQVDASAAAPRPTPVPAPVRTAPPAGLGAAPAGAAGAQPSEELKRLAATWAAMEPEKAAAVAQRLPDDQVTRVLAQMDADAAAGIMNALPPAVAARISRVGAQVAPPADR